MFTCVYTRITGELLYNQKLFESLSSSHLMLFFFLFFVLCIGNHLIQHCISFNLGFLPSNTTGGVN